MNNGKMKLIPAFYLLLLPLIAICAKPASGDEPLTKKWEGIYKSVINQGRTVGGSAVITELRLSLVDKNGELDCAYSEDGYQTLIRVLCTAEATDQSVKITFRKWAEVSSPTFETVSGKPFLILSKKKKDWAGRFENGTREGEYIFLRKIEKQ